MDTNKALLYLNMIIAEDEPLEIVQRSLDSVKGHVDGMYITVTYKDKNPGQNELVGVLNSYGANVSFFQWVDDFAAARQFAMDQVPKGPNIYIYWQDADDVLDGGKFLKKITQEAFDFHIAAVFFNYWYMVELDEEGNVREVLIEHKRERIIRNDDTFKWTGMLHEVLVEQRTENVQKIGRKECKLIHLTDHTRMDRGLERNVRILEKQAEKEQHKDPRTIIYLAKAYFDKAKMQETAEQQKIFFDLALMLFHEYLEGFGKPGTPGYQEGSGWPEERATAWGYVGEIARHTGHPEAAVGALQNAIDEAPQFPNYYIDLAMTYVMLDDYQKAKHWLRVATAVPSPDTTIITTPRDLKTRALEVDMQIAIHEGKLEQARQDCEMLIQIMPGVKELEDRLKTVVSLEAANKAAQSIVYLGKYLEDIKEDDKLQHLVQAIPNDLQTEKFAAEMRHRFFPPRVHESNEISILCGPGFEKWSPKSINNGLGGSEEAVVYLGQELTKKGWKVTVYANPMDEAGEYDGVNYRPWHEINVKDEFNVLVLWRGIGFVDWNPKAKYKLLWMHDVPNNPDFTQERVDKVDKIAVLSEYHKSLLRIAKEGDFLPMPENKVFLTANGIPDLKIKEWKGTPTRLIYSSSPDRGLIYLLTNWKKVKEAVPEAELHIFYGFEVFDAIHKNNPGRQKFKNQIMSLMRQEGITYHGRVGHNALHFEMAKSGIWAYPTDFTEISCITAMKAQALGAVPVTTTLAALDETVKNGIKVDVDITMPEAQEEYIEALIKLMKDPEQQDHIRKGMMEWARKQFSWKNVAEQWDELFRVNLQNPEKVYASRNQANP